MALQLLHQVGHNSNWNIASFEDDKCGDGLILSPLHQNITSIERLKASTRTASIFDPQFYLPSSRKPKLLTYPFFPESIGEGFQTSTFKGQAKLVAEKCVNYQKEQGFRKIVVPTRFIDQMYSDYIDRQRQFTVEAFMEAASSSDPLCLSVAVTSAMIEDPEFRTKLLNWITSYPNVEDVYLMYQHDRNSKQVQDAAFLKSCYSFFKQILNTGLKLTVGYTNVEGMLFSTVGDMSLTIGAFENTRIFSIDKFLVSDDERRGPKARIYLPGLLNWVQFEDARTIRHKAPDVWKRIYEGTPYSEQVINLQVEPTFNQPQLYKHYFLNMEGFVRQLGGMSPPERKNFLVEQISEARSMYEAIRAKGVELEKHGRGDHLAFWLESLK